MTLLNVSEAGKRVWSRGSPWSLLLDTVWVSLAGQRRPCRCAWVMRAQGQPRMAIQRGAAPPHAPHRARNAPLEDGELLTGRWCGPQACQEVWVRRSWTDEGRPNMMHSRRLPRSRALACWYVRALPAPPSCNTHVMVGPPLTHPMGRLGAAAPAPRQ